MQEAIDNALSRYEEIDLEPIRVYLSDFPECEVSGVTNEEIIHSAESFRMARECHSDTRPTVWVANNDFAFGIGRMRQTHGLNDEAEDLILCRSMQEGLDWVKDYLASNIEKS